MKWFKSFISQLLIKQIFYLLSIILICLASDVKAQLTNEVAFSLGPVFVLFWILI